MKGFSRSVKDALYTGCKSAAMSVGVGFLLGIWFMIIGVQEMDLNTLFSRTPGQIIMFAVLMTLLNSVMYPIMAFKTQLSMGCTRKNAAYGNMLANLISTCAVLAAVGIMVAFSTADMSENKAALIILYGSILLMASGAGSLFSIPIEKFGKKAYYVLMIPLCGISGGIGAMVSMRGSVGRMTEFFNSVQNMSLVLLGAALLFLAGHFVLSKYIEKLDLKL